MKKKWKRPKFKKIIGDLYKTKWNWFVTCPKKFTLGKNTDIGICTYINARYDVIIGSDTQIGSHCSIYSHDTERGIKGSIIIKSGTLIGAHTVILPRQGTPHLIEGKIRAGSIVK